MSAPDLLIEECSFWFVWTKKGRVPRFLHSSAESAEREADRLAKLSPGNKFIVLSAYRKSSVMPQPIVEMAQAEGGAS